MCAGGMERHGGDGVGDGGGGVGRGGGCCVDII